MTIKEFWSIFETLEENKRRLLVEYEFLVLQTYILIS